ncbi:MAG: tyrosine-type recombinase/integrase [Candidatus Thiodiazotropha sp. (ex Lucina pensylvanica)]|nr:tyrosine-type recombinase/integrase [Candidatus Thiodiazotropha sp. (ex Lucina pensylvanica)]
MARTTKPLTNTEVQQAKPRDKEFNLADGEGLALRVKPNGSKLWIFNYYRPYTKKRTSLSFGTYPTTTLADARKKRADAHKLLAKHIDPKEHRDEQNRISEEAHGNTLKHIAAQWLDIKKTTITPDHATDTWRSLELHVFPSMGKIPLHKVTAIKAIDTLKPVAAKGSLETIKRLCQRLNEIMVYVVNTGIIESNPLTGIRQAFQQPAKQHLPTLKPEELPVLLHKLTTASIKFTTRCLIEWQLHTMVRPGEAAGTRWEEIDIETAIWHIPAERMKREKDHIVPLTSQCLTLLELMQPISGRSVYVFPSDRDPRKHANPSTANMALKRMGFDKKLVAHGMRSLASTILNEEGFDADVIEAALAHIGDNDVRNAYNRANYLERRKPIMDWWSNHIEAAATGNMSLTGSKGLKLIGME